MRRDRTKGDYALLVEQMAKYVDHFEKSHQRKPARILLTMEQIQMLKKYSGNGATFMDVPLESFKP